jgi:hypothetical protein
MKREQKGNLNDEALSKKLAHNDFRIAIQSVAAQAATCITTFAMPVALGKIGWKGNILCTTKTCAHSFVSLPHICVLGCFRMGHTLDFPRRNQRSDTGRDRGGEILCILPLLTKHAHRFSSNLTPGNSLPNTGSHFGPLIRNQRSSRKLPVFGKKK